jgi:hypothetical protein
VEVDKMKKKNLLIITLILALSSLMIISAAVTYTLNFNMSANVAEAGTVTITIGSTDYTNGQSLNINWGTVNAGQQYTQAITIRNNVNNAVTPSIVATGLPAGWTLTLNDTSAISAFGTVSRNLVLNVPSNALVSNPSWTAVLTVTS